jgi:hypothetical protein
MTEYRDRTTGDIKTQGQLRKENPNLSLPKVWNNFTYDALNVDPVLTAPKPTENIGEFEVAVLDGVEQNSDGQWVQRWQIRDMYFDDEDGTKAEKEANHRALRDEAVARMNRVDRDRLMSETDWWASSDLTMTAEQTAYRQALRDITSHANWPHLGEDDWPTKP